MSYENEVSELTELYSKMNNALMENQSEVFSRIAFEFISRAMDLFAVAPENHFFDDIIGLRFGLWATSMRAMEKNGKRILAITSDWDFNGTWTSKNIVVLCHVDENGNATFCDREYIERFAMRCADSTYVRYNCGLPVCSKCFDIAESGVTKIIHEGMICEGCASKMELSVCLRCGNKYKSESEEHVYICGEETIVCPNCANEAIECRYHDRLELDSGQNYVENENDYVCDDAIQTGDYSCCENCGELFYVHDDGWYGEYEGETLCRSCAENMEDEGEIRSYYYKPDPKFFIGEGDYSYDEEGGKLYLGIELEVDGDHPGRFSTELVDALGSYVYVKHDGSLDNGAEVVTHPLESNFALEWDGWEKIRAIALDNGMESHNPGTCGLHIHLNRLFFGKTELQRDYAISKLIYVFDKFEDDLMKFSRRRSADVSQWCRFPHGDMQPEDDEIKRKDKLKNVSYTRYTAINLQNENTVEVRLWRGTLNLDTLFATIDFTQALARFVKHEDYPVIDECKKFGDLIDKIACYAKDDDKIRQYAISRNCE